jgi:alkanesulfonate monooxygenase SsuD/methylene tetrahydromethanopterin reductase-like flavin-dependent oxidoreductase (luciferase family)
MPDRTAPLKVGANLWNQHTDWPGFRDAMLRAEALGYDSLWTWDHVYPIVGTPDGPILEAWTAMAAIAALTTRPTIGHLVGANTFRNPALTAKMITTIDHISGGRAVLGIGAAWFEPEHTAYGVEYGTGFPERLRWLREALPIMRGMLDGTEPTVTEGRYRTQAVRNDPPPIQAHLPILIGGGGRKVTLKLVAQYADMNNLGNPVEAIAGAEEALLGHCETLARNGGALQDEDRPGSASVERDRAAVGTAEDVFRHLAPIVEAGYHHLICGFPSPYDRESMERLQTEVRPRLEAMVQA